MWTIGISVKTVRRCICSRMILFHTNTAVFRQIQCNRLQLDICFLVSCVRFRIVHFWWKNEPTFISVTLEKQSGIPDELRSILMSWALNLGKSICCQSPSFSFAAFHSNCSSDLLESTREIVGRMRPSPNVSLPYQKTEGTINLVLVPENIYKHFM